MNAIGDRGIVDVFGFGQLPDGRQYLIMEYLQGERLEALYRERKLGIGEAVSLLDQILRALAAAHGAGVIHRDLKPQNIFAMRSPDGTRYIKLLDFGLARRMSPTSKQTAGGTFSGTPNYMSPEQLRREALTARSDLYSVGAIGFELLTGRPPFDANTTSEVVQRHLSAPIPSAKALRPDVPAELDALLTRLLSKRAEDRPASVEIVRGELAKIRKARQAISKRVNDPRKGDGAEELSSPGMPVFQDPPASKPDKERSDARKRSGAEPSPKPAPDASRQQEPKPPPTLVEFLPVSAADPLPAVRHSAAASVMRMIVLGAGAFTLVGLGLWAVSFGSGATDSKDGTDQSAAHSTAQLVARIDALFAAVQREEMVGGRPPGESALAQLRRLRIEAVDTEGPLEVARVDRLVTAWEREHLRLR